MRGVLHTYVYSVSSLSVTRRLLLTAACGCPNTLVTHPLTAVVASKSVIPQDIVVVYVYL